MSATHSLESLEAARFRGSEDHSVSIQALNKDWSVYLLLNILVYFGFLSYESSTTDLYLYFLIYSLGRGR